MPWDFNNKNYRKPKIRNRQRAYGTDDFQKDLIHGNAMAGPDERLRSMPASLDFYDYKRGNITPEDIDKAPIPIFDTYASWQAKNPEGELWRLDYPGTDYDTAERVKPDFSNLRPTDSVLPFNPFAYSQDRIYQYRSIQPQVMLKRVNIDDPKQVATIFKAYDNIRNVMNDWEGALRDDAYLDGFYDLDTDERKREDGWLIRQNIEKAGGDVKRGLEAAFKDLRISNWGYQALKSLIGHREDSSIPIGDRDKLLDANFDRFFNAYEKANSMYDRNANKASSPIGYKRVSDPDYNEWFRQKADEDFRRANHLSRGGRMSTPPKSFRVPGGYRVGRAEGLGNDEYDVYF